MIIHAHKVRSASVSSVLLCPWFVILVLAGAIERLCGLALGVAMERDWLVLVMLFYTLSWLLLFLSSRNLIIVQKFYHVQLAGTNRPIALAQANAAINRIDLLCEVTTFFFLFSFDYS